jgi:hypothetical protein
MTAALPKIIAAAAPHGSVLDQAQQVHSGA